MPPPHQGSLPALVICVGMNAPAVTLRPVGSSGLSASVVGLGCNNFGRRIDADAAARVVHASLDAGITFFDTADIYGGGRSEEYLGSALRGRRDGCVIATKFGGAMGDSPYQRGGSRRWIRLALEGSLRRLGVDWIDLYYLHFPDPAVPIEETLGTLDDLVAEGKVRYAGASNLAGWQIADADWAARSHELAPFVCAQNEYNLLVRDVEREEMPACIRFQLGLIPYFPLAMGALTGKYHRGEVPPPGTRLAVSPQSARHVLTDSNFDIIEALHDFANDRDRSLVDIAIGWLAAQPQVASVIAGASTPEQVQANVRAATWVPTAADLAEIDRITTRDPRPAA